MSPKERKRWERRAWDFCESEHAWEHQCITCQQLAEAFHSAIAEEREACAKVAESWQPTGSHPGIATAIRARGNHAPPC